MDEIGNSEVLKNFLCLEHPEIFNQIAPLSLADKSLDLKKITLGSDKRLFWECPVNNDHIWQVSLYFNKNHSPVNYNYMGMKTLITPPCNFNPALYIMPDHFLIGRFLDKNNAPIGKQWEHYPRSEAFI